MKKVIVACGTGIATSTVVCVKTSYSNDKIPVIRALSFLTGIGMEQDIQKIVDILS